MKTNDVVGLGNALMDFLVRTEEAALSNLNLNKGEMHLVEEEKAKQLLGTLNPTIFSPGGSAANTIKGISFLGGKTILYGKVGNDQYGESYIQNLNSQGVVTRIGKHQKTTGHALTFITPDSERTFSVHLGAALELSKEDLLEEDIRSSKVLHLEAYQLEGKTKGTILQAIKLAKQHNTLVSIDLADPSLIRRNKEFFQSLLKEIDIIFLNEEEAKEFTEKGPEEALLELSEQTQVVVVKIGKEGSLISSQGMVSRIEAFPATAVDTTGAGDSYAAGFLYGFCQGWEIEKAGQLGSLLAAKIVEQIGVNMEELNQEELFNSLLTR